MDNLNILLEYYVGNSRDKRFKQCEECLLEIIKEIKPQQEIGNRYNVMRKIKDYTYHPANVKLQKLLADIFSMKAVNLYWDRGDINAYTYPPTIWHKYSNKVNVEAKDKKFVNMTAHIVLYENLVSEADLNEKELMAIILHEMGHNFTVIPFRFYSDILQSTIYLPFTYLQKLIYKGNHILRDKVIYKYLYPIVNLIDMGSNILDTVNNFTGFAQSIEILTLLLTGRAKLTMPTDPITVIDNLGRYQDEKVSDSFCAVYGYGPYQISALDKMNKHKYSTHTQLKDKVGINSTYHIIDDVNTLIMGSILSLVMEPHPNVNVRYHSIRRKLENELKTKNLPKEYKKELEEQLEEMDKIYAQLDKYSEDELITLKKSIYKIADELTQGHSDWREIFSSIDKSLIF